MKSCGPLREKWRAVTAIAGTPLPGIPIVELAGDRRVLIEHHRGVVEYGSDRVSVRVSYGIFTVEGRNLQIHRMTAQQLIVCGWIDGLSLQKGENRAARK